MHAPDYHVLQFYVCFATNIVFLELQTYLDRLSPHEGHVRLFLTDFFYMINNIYESLFEHDYVCLYTIFTYIHVYISFIL